MIKQPEKSSLCGQCCLGTILNISLDEAINLIGHKHGTRTKELIKHFKTDGNRLKRMFLADYSLCKVHYNTTKETHWVIYKDGNIYDPLVGDWLRHAQWMGKFAEHRPRITSSIEIIEQLKK